MTATATVQVDIARFQCSTETPSRCGCCLSSMSHGLGLAAAYPAAIVPGFRTAAYVPFLVVAAALGSITVVIPLRAPQPIPHLVALRSHEYLVVDRLVLAGGFIAGAGRAPPGLILAAAAVAVTLLSLAGMMCGRYEPRRQRAGKPERAGKPDQGGN